MPRGDGWRGHGLAAGAVKGAIAGAVGTWVMDQLGWGMYLREDAQALEQEELRVWEGRTSPTLRRVSWPLRWVESSCPSNPIRSA